MAGPERALGRFVIDRSDFESGILADTVGVLRPDGAREWTPSDGVRVAEQARRGGYELVMLRTEAPVELAGFRHVGTLMEYEGSPGTVRERVSAGAGHFEVVPLAAEQWPAVEPLLDHAAPTRFSRDPRLAPGRARALKLRVLRQHYDRFPHYTVVAPAAGGRLRALQSSFVADGAFVLYELVTAPQPRRALLAADLLARNFAMLAARDPAIARVRTLIYDDNADSTTFFSRIGLGPTGRRHHHYHLWP